MEEVQKQIGREDCLRVLEKSLNSKDFELEHFEVLVFHKPLQGLVGEHYTLKIKYVYKDETNTEEFFMKTLSANPLLFEFSKSVMVYEKESFFYQLLDEFKQFDIDTSFAPRGYFFKPHLIVLQDLSRTNHESTPKKTLLDLEHCQVCIDTLAKFHGATIVYEKIKGEELGRKYSLQEDHTDLLEDKFMVEEETLATKWVATSIKGLFSLIDMIPENQVNRDEFKAALSQLLIDNTPMEGVLSTILHGDLWTSNFLYLYKDGKPVQSKLLDYQMINYGPIEQDVVRFLMTNTSRQFREDHFNDMVERYFDKLKEVVSRSGFAEILPEKEVFVSSCENFKLPGKVNAIIDHSFTFVDDDIVSESLETEESFRNYLFEERGKYVEESYRRNKEFGERLTEDILELRDFLFS